MDATHHYEWDAVGTMRANSGGPISTQFVYTANDERIATYATGHWNWTVRDGSGAVLRELTSEDTATTLGTANWTWTQDYIYRGAQLLATDSPIGRRHYHLDHLGTPRLVTDDAARRLGTHDYVVFGAELATTLRETPEETHKFTGHERDADGTVYGLDYMHARYYGAQWGRFVSVDPSLDLKRTATNSQMWNRYAYVHNRPLQFVGPNGREALNRSLLQFFRLVYGQSFSDVSFHGVPLFGDGLTAGRVVYFSLSAMSHIRDRHIVGVGLLGHELSHVPDSPARIAIFLRRIR
jgi:RHS repeat-associated protein